MNSFEILNTKFKTPNVANKPAVYSIFKWTPNIKNNSELKRYEKGAYMLKIFL